MKLMNKLNSVLLALSVLSVPAIANESFVPDKTIFFTIENKSLKELKVTITRGDSTESFQVEGQSRTSVEKIETHGGVKRVLNRVTLTLPNNITYNVDPRISPTVTCQDEGGAVSCSINPS